LGTIPSIDTNGSFGKQQLEACKRAVKAIMQIGIVVDQPARIHQKAVVIDYGIDWSCSINQVPLKAKLSSLFRLTEK
tara:strand:- start:1834 stop:2064 length:231 start_codon:yes stop_codon:yes gene_type:complete